MLWPGRSVFAFQLSSGSPPPVKHSIEPAAFCWQDYFQFGPPFAGLGKGATLARPDGHQRAALIRLRRSYPARAHKLQPPREIRKASWRRLTNSVPSWRQLDLLVPKGNVRGENGEFFHRQRSPTWPRWLKPIRRKQFKLANRLLPREKRRLLAFNFDRTGA